MVYLKWQKKRAVICLCVTKGEKDFNKYIPGKQDFPPQSLKQHFFSPIQSASVEHSSGRPQSEPVLIIFGQTPSFLSFRHTGLKRKYII